MIHRRHQPVEFDAPSRAWRLGRSARNSVWPVGVVIGGLALVALFTKLPGQYVMDNRLEHAWSPWSLLQDQLNLWVAREGLGRAGEEFWPVAVAVLGILRSAGLSPAAAERVWHAMLLTSAAVGVAACLRVFRPRVGIEHFVAAFVVAFNPCTAVALTPSNVFASYAFAPWLMLCALRAVREDGWRWPATFALLLFAAGSIDAPGLTYATVPAVVAIAQGLVSSRLTRRRALTFVLRASVLVGAILSAALYKLVSGSAALTQRLASTESPEFVNVASSWAESWRGLGTWILYFAGPWGLPKPEAARFLNSPLVVLATFSAPVAGLGFLWRSRWRHRSLWACLLVVSLVLMVGSYPPEQPPPLGSALLLAYRRWLPLWGWRSSYKAAPGWAISVGVLAGLGVRRLLPLPGNGWWERGWTRWRTGTATVLILGIGVTSASFWTGPLYARSAVVPPVPGYWREALGWLDSQPGDGRVLVLPGTTITDYRWGYAGGDIIGPLLGRRHLSRVSFPYSTELAADLLAHLDSELTRGYQPGALAPIAQRLGIEFVLIRNDLDWVRARRARPSQLEALRRDPQVVRVRTFGSVGENVLAPGDKSLAALVEAKLPPVEVYRVQAPIMQIAESEKPPVLVSGDGEAWGPMARRGLLDRYGAVRYTAQLSRREVLAQLQQGAAVVISDSNRRRWSMVNDRTDESSYTLPLSVATKAAPRGLFGRPGSFSYTSYEDVADFSASSYGEVFGHLGPQSRPPNAFDGDIRSEWSTSGIGTGKGSWVKAELRQQVRLSRVAVVTVEKPGWRRVTAVRLRFSTGDDVTAAVKDGFADIRFASRLTKSITVQIESEEGWGAAIGIAEVGLEGVKTVERVHLPDDMVRLARATPSISRALAAAPLEYQMVRQRSDDGADEELALRRVVAVDRSRTFLGSGWMRTGSETSERTLAAVLGGYPRAYGTSREGPLDYGGLAAFDGGFDKGWRSSPKAGERLAFDLAPQPVSYLDVAVATWRSGPRPLALRLHTDEGPQAEVAVPDTSCGGDRCISRVRIPASLRSASHLELEVSAVAAGSGGPPILELAEVEVNGRPNRASSQSVSSDCIPGLISVDGVPRSVRIDGTAEAAIQGRPLRLEMCDPLELGAGVHRIDSAAEIYVNELVLASPGRTSPGPPASVEIENLRRGPAALEMKVTSDGPVRVTTGDSYDARWRLHRAGRPAQPPLRGEVLSTWVVEAGTHNLRIDYPPQRTYRALLVVSGLALLASLVLALPRAARRPQ